LFSIFLKPVSSVEIDYANENLSNQNSNFAKRDLNNAPNFNLKYQQKQEPESSQGNFASSTAAAKLAQPPLKKQPFDIIQNQSKNQFLNNLNPNHYSRTFRKMSICLTLNNIDFFWEILWKNSSLFIYLFSSYRKIDVKSVQGKH